MSNRLHSLLIGAAIAAVVILPAKADDAGWVNGPWRTYDARTLKLDDVVGTVRVDVKDGGPMAVQVSGLRDRVNGVSVNAGGGTLRIESAGPDGVWDWRHWFDFSHMDADKPDQLVIHVAVPRGAAVRVNDLVGNAAIGDTQGPLTFESAGYTRSTIGNVTDAHLSLAGSGKLSVANVAGPLYASTAGSGDIKVGDAARVDADIAGSGSVSVGRVGGPIKVDIAGSGNFSAVSVNGPTKADIAGSGSVTIAGGEANPFHVDIMGSGNVTFGGMAVDPKISAMGSGNVKIRAYRGKLSNDGMSNLKIGS
jgi:hypothetical protein